MDPLEPKTLKNASVLEARLAQIYRERRVSPLNDWVSQLQSRTGLPVPWFDPADGGTEAEVLFLLETPGSRADAGKGSGIISVDNNDDTAKNLWTFRHCAGLVGRQAVHWNAVPEFIGGRVPDSAEIRQGVERLAELLELLDRVEVVVPMGRHAQKAWARYCLKRPNQLVTIPTWHPSKLGLNRPGRRDEVQIAVTRASMLIDGSAETPRETLQPRRADFIRELPDRAKKRAADLRKGGSRRYGSDRRGSSGLP